MQKQERHLLGNRVVPIKQSGAFFQRRAHKHLDRSNYIGALGCLRRALQTDPLNASYWLDMAETFTDMQCFDESNHILFSLAPIDTSNECFFGMGCNFLGLQEFDKARESFETYMRLEPDGVYCEDAEDLLDLLDEHIEPISTTLPPRIQQLVLRGKQALDAGDAKRAKRYLEKALQHEPDLTHARNNLALSHYSLHEYDQAVHHAQLVLASNDDNLYAHCTLAMVAHALGDEQTCLQHIDAAEHNCDETPSMLSRFCGMLCELRMHERALPALRQLVNLRPYDAHTLHSLAVAYTYNEQLPKAIQLWGRIQSVDPENTIASWYFVQARSALREGLPFEPSYAYQVPYAEALNRLHRIHEYVLEGAESMRRHWQQQSDLRQLLQWGLTTTDTGIKRAILGLIASFQDPHAERVLRMFLGKREEPDTLKREVFGMLKQMKAQEPFVAYLDDNIVEVRVNMLSHPLDLSRETNQVLEIACARAEDFQQNDLQTSIKQIWTRYLLHHQSNLPKITKPESWAAALIYVASLHQKEECSVTELCQCFHISPRTLRMLSSRLMRTLDAPQQTTYQEAPDDTH